MVKRLTAIGVEQIKPSTTRFELTDGTSGLRLVVQPSGARSWCIRYRRPGSRRTAKLTIGSWPAVSLAQARADAAAALREIADGNDPSAARKDAKAAAEVVAGNTLRAIAEAHLRYEEGKSADERLRTIDQRRATFERLIYPVLGGRPIAEIKRGEIMRLLDDVEAKRGGRMA